MDYQARGTENMLLDVEFHDGDISKEEHAWRCWSADELWPEGGWVADPRMEGPGYTNPEVVLGGLGGPRLCWPRV